VAGARNVDTLAASNAFRRGVDLASLAGPAQLVQRASTSTDESTYWSTTLARPAAVSKASRTSDDESSGR